MTTVHCCELLADYLGRLGYEVESLADGADGPGRALRGDAA